MPSSDDFEAFLPEFHVKIPPLNNEEPLHIFQDSGERVKEGSPARGYHERKQIVGHTENMTSKNAIYGKLHINVSPT